MLLPLVGHRILRRPARREHLHYRIYLKEELNPSWQTWFAGMEIEHEESGTTILSGFLPDQAALFGALFKIHRLGLTLLALENGEEVPLAQDEVEIEQ